MKREWRIPSAVTLLFLLFCTSIHAQTIVDELQAVTNPADGVIRIESDPAITALIGTPNGAGGVSERPGFRIHVFRGNDPGKARGEATSKQTAIREAFPELSTYLVYEAPNWKLLAGDFFTREEANLVMQQLQKKFPQFGKEMYIVTDKIKIPLE